MPVPGRVLVVDDSALMRKLLAGLLGEAGWDVHVARNGREGVEQLLAVEPDVVTLDINMPEMDGLTALSLMMAARPTPVVMVSSLTEEGAAATFEALALGAVDFIPKPGGTISVHVDEIRELLLQKVTAARGARIRGARAASIRAPRAPRGAAPAPVPVRAARPIARNPATGQPDPVAELPGLVLVGVSTGGPRTLAEILPKLPADFPWPVMVAQHMPPRFTEAFARRLDSECALEAVEVTSPVPLVPGRIYVGRAGTDLVAMRRGGRLYAGPRPESATSHWHPSVDVLVDSAMQCLPADALTGVQLTGMGYDGAEAMTRLRQAGGRTIAEDESTAVVFGMPQELIRRGGATEVLPCDRIADRLLAWARMARSRGMVAA